MKYNKEIKAKVLNKYGNIRKVRVDTQYIRTCYINCIKDYKIVDLEKLIGMYFSVTESPSMVKKYEKEIEMLEVILDKN